MKNDRSLLNLYLATGFSNLGDGISLAAFPLLAARYGATPLEIGYIMASRTLPWLLLSLPAGALIDYIGPKAAMALVGIGRAIVAMSVALLILLSNIDIVILVVIAFFIGSFEVIFDNSAQSILPRIVGKDLLTSALGRQQSIEMAINRFIAIPLGGVLMVFHSWVPFAAISLAYLIATLRIILVRTSAASIEDDGKTKNTFFGREFFAGMQYVWWHPVLFWMALTTSLSNFATQGVEAVFVLFVTQVVKAPDWAFGLLLATEGIGAILGALIAARVKASIGEADVLKFVILTIPFFILLTPMFLNPWIIAVAHFLLGIDIGLWGAVAVSFRQAVVPARLMGRANAFYRLVAWGSLPLGSLAGGWSASILGFVGNYFLFGCLLIGVWATIPKFSNGNLREARLAAGASQR